MKLGFEHFCLGCKRPLDISFVDNLDNQPLQIFVEPCCCVLQKYKDEKRRTLEVLRQVIQDTKDKLRHLLKYMEGIAPDIEALSKELRSLENKEK